MSKLTAISLFQLVWHILKLHLAYFDVQFDIFGPSGPGNSASVAKQWVVTTCANDNKVFV